MLDALMIRKTDQGDEIMMVQSGMFIIRNVELSNGFFRCREMGP